MKALLVLLSLCTLVSSVSCTKKSAKESTVKSDSAKTTENAEFQRKNWPKLAEGQFYLSNYLFPDRSQEVFLNFEEGKGGINEIYKVYGPVVSIDRDVTVNGKIERGVGDSLMYSPDQIKFIGTSHKGLIIKNVIKAGDSVRFPTDGTKFIGRVTQKLTFGKAASLKTMGPESTLIQDLDL